jgi:hypothetical protein
MDIPQSPTPLPSPLPSQPDVAELAERVDSLQNLISKVLLLLLMVSGTLATFIYWQLRMASRELENGRQQVKKLAEQQQAVLHSLSEFARTHPDFTPIIAKYIKPNGTTGAPPATATAPAPAKK